MFRTAEDSGPYDRYRKIFNKPEFAVDKCCLLGHNVCYNPKNAVKRRVRWQETVREPRLVRVGTEKAAEHGLGAGAVRETKPSSGAPVTALSRRCYPPNGFPAKPALWGKGEAKAQAEFPACRKWSVVACAPTQNKVVPR